jgi:hypothetical protein
MLVTRRTGLAVITACGLAGVLPSCGQSSGHHDDPGKSPAGENETGGAPVAETGGAGSSGAGMLAGASNGGSTAGRASSGGGPASGEANAKGGTSSAGGGGAGDGAPASGGVPSNGGTSSGGAGGAAAGGANSAGMAGGSGGAVGTRPFKGVANSPCAARTALGVSWYYNWMQRENEPCSDGRGGEFVPMIWGHTGVEQSQDGIKSAVSGFVDKGYRYVLGFNEPDNSTQANISVAAAIGLLPSFGNPAILVGTAATQANTTGQAWFKDYMGQVNANAGANLRADFIAIHWYGWNAGSCDAKASQLESYIKYAEGFPGNRPIWITEWGCLNQSAPTADGVVEFYKGALAVFAKHPRLERYAWYPWSTNCGLTNSDGTLTALGTAYAAAPARR